VQPSDSPVPRSGFWARLRERAKYSLLKISDWLETDLATRIFVALIYFPILLLSTYWPEAFGGLIGVAMGVSWYEYLSFKKKPTSPEERTHALLLAAFFSLPALLVIFSGPIVLALGFYFFAAQISWYRAMRAGASLKEWWDDCAYYLFGLIYITGLFSLILYTHSFNRGGREAVWFLLMVVGATDSLAYFAGRKFGRVPFFQNLSPKKTREGFIGGVLGGMISALLFSLVLRHHNFDVPGPITSVFLGGILAVVSAFGDLFESQLKRSHGVKDAGQLFPGHGGALDRFDGVIFASVPLAIFLILFKGFHG